MLTLAQKHTASPRSEAHSRGPRFQEAIGKPISILNGKGFDPAAGKELFARFLQASTKLTRCINVTKDGRRLSHDAVLSKQNNGQIKCLSTNLTLAAPAISGTALTLPRRTPSGCGRHEDEHTKMRRVREGAAGARSARWPASPAVVG